MLLIPNWRRAWRWWSVRVSALAALLATFAIAAPDLVAQIWAQLPPELLGRLPASAQMIVPLILSLAQILARVLKQPEPGKGLGVAGKVTPKVAKLGAVLGTVAGALALMISIPAEESGRKVEASVQADGSIAVRHVSGPQYLRAYLDIVGVATACDGITKGVKLGQIYTERQCAGLLEAQLIEHAKGVIACVPGLYGRDYQAPAAVSLAYNVGVQAFCGSTSARHFRAQRWTDGCRAMAMWVRAGGRVVTGLVRRREREIALCLRGLAA